LDFSGERDANESLFDAVANMTGMMPMVRRITKQFAADAPGGGVAVMSAEIIQFGKPQSATRPGRNEAHDRAPDTTIGKRHLVNRRHKKASVRVMFDGELYEVVFYGDDVQVVYAIRYRISAGGVQEMKRSRWQGGGYWSRDLNPALVKAAWRARASG
jgi:hypothetical protein